MCAQNLKKALVAGLAVMIVGSFVSDAAVAAHREVVGYRLRNWKTIHFDDARKADDRYRTLRKLGCEATKDAHAGHIDVTYRCPRWRELSLRSHRAAHRWEDWLRAAGFETVHKH
jgi:G:T/U-mismatch repair DNA glycosylase